MTFDRFFLTATGNDPYDYQRRLAAGERNNRPEAEWLTTGTTCDSRLISIPTGLGKTAAVVLTQLRLKLSTSTAIFFFIVALRQHTRP